MRQVMKVVAGIGVALLVLVGFSGVAGAQYEPSDEVLEFDFPSQVQAGGELNVSGNCSIEGEDVTFTLGDITLGTVTPDENGDFSATFTVPADLAPGTYTLAGTCGDQLVAEGTVEVLGAGGSNGGGGAGAGGVNNGSSGGTSGGSTNTGSTPLARTGFDARPVVTLGAAALVLGGAAVYGSRRRRSIA